MPPPPSTFHLEANISTINSVITKMSKMVDTFQSWHSIYELMKQLRSNDGKVFNLMTVRCWLSLSQILFTARYFCRNKDQFISLRRSIFQPAGIHKCLQMVSCEFKFALHSLEQFSKCKFMWSQSTQWTGGLVPIYSVWKCMIVRWSTSEKPELWLCNCIQYGNEQLSHCVLDSFACVIKPLLRLHTTFYGYHHYRITK